MIQTVLIATTRDQKTQFLLTPVSELEGDASHASVSQEFSSALARAKKQPENQA
ncbi:MAG: hypothetical protein V4691_10085 [Pseudomonadota bacterium]